MTIKDGIITKNDGTQLCNQGELRFNSLLFDDSANGYVYAIIYQAYHNSKVYRYDIKKDRFTILENTYYDFVELDDKTALLYDVSTGSYGEFKSAYVSICNRRKGEVSAPCSISTGIDNVRLLSHTGSEYVIALTGSHSMGAFSHYSAVVRVLWYNSKTMQITEQYEIPDMGSFCSPLMLYKKKKDGFSLDIVNADHIACVTHDRIECFNLEKYSRKFDMENIQSVDKVTLSKDGNTCKVIYKDKDGLAHLLTAKKTQDRGITVSVTEVA